MKDRLLTYGRGVQRGGYNEKQISFADFLSKYLEDFGDVCFEFKAQNLLAKNRIYPFDYKLEKEYFYLPDGFPSMPFWECEWQSKRVKFEYADINKVILFSDRLHIGQIEFIIGMFKQFNVKYEITEFSKLPEPDYDFFIKRYLKRMREGRKINVCEVK